MGDIYLVRHGQASFGTDNYDRLSPAGIEQAQWMGKHFQSLGLEFDRVVIGAMVRHRQTLEFAACCAAEPEVEPGLNEYDFHSLVDGYLRQFPPATSIDLKDPRAFYRQLRITLGAWADGSLTTGLPESWADFEGRVKKSLQTLTADAGAQRVLVVSSGGAISALVREVLGLSVEQMITMNLQMMNTGITRLMFKGDKVRMQSWNGVPHLERPETKHLLSFT